MNVGELAKRLLEEGCNPSTYAIGSRGTAWDAYCLTFSGTWWEVYYTERGLDSAPIFTSESQSEACAFFFQHITSMRHDHCVGYFRSEQKTSTLHRQLRGIGLEPWQDRIPYGLHDPRFRVFVIGKEIFAAKQALGTIPVRDVQE